MAIYINGHKYPHYDRGPGLTIATNVNQGKNALGDVYKIQEHSIGIYHRKGEGPPVTALGGREYSSYDICRISVLVHWDKDVRASERAAYKFYEKLQDVSSLVIGETPVHFLILQVPEPVDVGTDDNGVYEYVIWVDFVYQRK